MKKLLAIGVVVLTPIFGIWVAFARDLPLPDVPLWVGLPAVLGMGAVAALIFQKCANYLIKKGRSK